MQSSLSYDKVLYWVSLTHGFYVYYESSGIKGSQIVTQDGYTKVHKLLQA